MRNKKQNSINWQYVLFSAVVVLMAMSFFAIIIMATTDEPEKTRTTQATEDICQQPMEGIRYEETFLYKEELERKRDAERIREEQLKRQQEEEKIQMLSTIAKVIYVEAIGESMKGKIAVGATVINRIADPNFPDTIEEVLLGEYFEISGVPDYADISWVTDEMITQECLDAARAAINGEDPFAEELDGPTLFFYNPEKISDNQLEKREGIKVVEEGEHLFHHEPPRWN